MVIYGLLGTQIETYKHITSYEKNINKFND